MSAPEDTSLPAAAARVLAFCATWEEEARGPHMYCGYGRKAETDDPAERMSIADLRTLAEAVRLARRAS